MRKITALNIAAIIFMVSLTACGNSAEDVAGASENIAQDTYFDTADEIILIPETYEDYIKLSNTYLQTDDVLQALAILDEGIEKLGAEEQETAKQGVDLLSQRREYVLAGTVAVGTNSITNRYDDDGNILHKYVRECDENGNELRNQSVYYNEEGGIRYLAEFWYDGNEKQTERKYIDYDSDGNITNFSHEARVYDENGKEIENISYDEHGNIKEKTKYEYDSNGKNIEETDYNKDDKIVRQVEIEYDAAGREAKWECYDEHGRCSIQRIYTRDERGKLIQYDEYHDGYTTKEEYERDENGNTIKSVHYDSDGNTTKIYEYEYDENGRMINYTGYDKYGNVLVKRETEYDTSGKVMRKNEYDADDNLIRYFENEYDDFGSLTKQTIYKNGILKSEKETSYAYHYIGNIDAEAADYMDDNMTLEEYNLKQREIFTG